MTTAIIIGQPENCLCLEQQLNLLPERPVTIGWVLTDAEDAARCEPGDPVLGALPQLEAIFARRKPGLALVTLPAVMADQVQSIRTRLRRMEIPDRFMPTLEDQLAGVGPRSQFAIDLGDLLDRPPRRVDEQAISMLLYDRRVLITGAGGSIGGELARVVARYGPAALLLVERSENSLFEIDRQIARFHPELERAALLHDIVDPASTLELFERVQPDVIFHAAAHKHVPMMETHPAQAVENNVFGTKSVADAAVQVGAERFVMVSTDKAVNPSSIMGATKRLAEMYIQDIHGRAHTGFSMVRFGNVLGSSGSVIETWCSQLAEGGPLTVTDDRMTRFFMTIPEAASLVIQAAALSDPASPAAEVFVLDMGEPVAIVEMARRFVRLHGLATCEAEVHGPGEIGISLTGIRPGEKLHEELARDTDALRPTRHPDIQIWGLPTPDPAAVQTMIQQLDQVRRGGINSKVAEVVRGLVPEMIEPVAA